MLNWKDLCDWKELGIKKTHGRAKLEVNSLRGGVTVPVTATNINQELKTNLCDKHPWENREKSDWAQEPQTEGHGWALIDDQKPAAELLQAGDEQNVSSKFFLCDSYWGTKHLKFEGIVLFSDVLIHHSFILSFQKYMFF